MPDDIEIACGSNPLDAGSQPVSGDGDPICDAIDNCPDDANEDQADLDDDGEGDVCDDDVDGDGASNGDEEACGSDPLDVASAPADGDADSVCDPLDNRLMCLKLPPLCSQAA